MDISSGVVDVVSKARDKEDDIRYIEPDQPQFLVTETTSSIRSCLAAYTSEEVFESLRVMDLHANRARNE